MGEGSLLILNGTCASILCFEAISHRKQLKRLARRSTTGECQQIRHPLSFVHNETTYGGRPLIMTSSLRPTKMTESECCTQTKQRLVDLKILTLIAMGSWSSWSQRTISDISLPGRAPNAPFRSIWTSWRGILVLQCADLEQNGWYRSFCCAANSTGNYW